ncbi:MAG TPA: UbiA family prenyltransferase [Candidatus Paceibacterota bacterium]|nr:UbiA family prenyltransferase [Candidatus Paceibacterota bacterium]
MDESAQASQSKISLTEAIGITLILIIVSLVNLIPLAGDVTSFIAGGLMFYYLYSKGLTGTSVVATNFVGYGVGFFPLIQALPTELVAWIVTVIIDRLPKPLQAVIEKVGEAEGGAEGGAGPAEGAIGESATVAGNAGTAAREAETVTAEAGEAGAGAAGGAREAGGTGAPAGEGGETAGGGAEPANRRPSEESTEGAPTRTTQAETWSGEAGNPGIEGGGEEAPKSEEERRKEAARETYEKLTTPDVMQNPIDVAKRNELGADVPVSAPPKETPEEPSPAKKQLADRANRINEKNRGLEIVRPPQNVTEEPENADQDEEDDLELPQAA